MTSINNTDVNLNDYKTSGKYVFSNDTSGTITNNPFTGDSSKKYALVDVVKFSNAWIFQFVFNPVERSSFYFRCWNFDRWYAWAKVEGTIVY